jgi:carbon monoxide dehydrogenase subunit G
MSLRAETTVRIARSPAEVFAFISDPENLYRWDPAIRSVRLTEPGPVRLNSGLIIVAEDGGRPVTIDSHVTDFEPDRVFGVTATFSGVPLRLRWRVEPDGAGTRLTARGEAEVGGLLALAGGVITGMVEDRLIRAHANLKRILEAPG